MIYLVISWVIVYIWRITDCVSRCFDVPHSVRQHEEDKFSHDVRTVASAASRKVAAN